MIPASVAADELEALLGPTLAAAVERLVDERVAAALAQQPNGTPWLSLADAANYISVSPRMIDRLIARGKLRAAKVGRRRLVHRDDLDGLLR